ncbi:alpha/beta hydrolase [Rheinheimera soli]|jgi:pimeloyl-ACP methyl ester carboxylesterase|uniref:Pimeloyl-ACP methyl ester carboxylesterase n=1 Tax=Rheinheimera soli TaxID=443616 RepID=A0ABU1W3M9_9GAMM|nr:alpha/beta hydrolase [Rheinheimera soli]MDR7122585.1 pimeloyl-ACP methyl ester carboxylesterase [Rheinheimera soli]
MLVDHGRSQKPDPMKTKLYLIPGTLCNARLWSELAPYLSNYELEHLPIPSGADPEHLVEQLAPALPAHKSVLLGFSLGAYLAALLTLRYPEKVAALILISNSPCPLSSEEQESRQQNIQLIQKFGYKGISQKKAEALVDSAKLSPDALQHIVNIIRQMDAELGEHALKAQLGVTSERRDLKDELLKLTQPLCFVYSEQDPLINTHWMQDFMQSSQKLHQQDSQVVFHAIAGSGHMLPLEQPALLSRYIKQWLSENINASTGP